MANNQYEFKYLQSDIPYQAEYVDSNLKNPSSIIKSDQSSISSVNYLTNTVTIYSLDGIFKSKFNIPTNYPTSITRNTENTFIFTYNNNQFASELIIVTSLGYIYGYNKNADPDNAIVLYYDQNKSYEDVKITSSGRYIYVTESNVGNIERYDGKYVINGPVNVYTDSIMKNINYIPYGLNIIDNLLYVTYINSFNFGYSNSGFGYINIYDMNGIFKRRFANSGSFTNGPSSVVEYNNDIIISNSGDGKIPVYSKNGEFKYYLEYKNSNTSLIITDVNDLCVINDRLYFVAGINYGNNGVLGYIHPNKKNNKSCQNKPTNIIHPKSSCNC